MRLVSWNCQGAFARKLALAEALAPDVLVVPECEQLDSLTQSLGAKPLRSIQWVGDMPRKGLGVFTFGDYSLGIHPAYDPRYQWVLPLRVSGPFSFTLIAVWTVPHPESKSYVQPLRESLSTYGQLPGDDVLWAGDFNAGLRFDKPTTRHKFADFVAALEAKNIHSLYHRKTGCPHGKETDSTFYMQRNPAKGYHIDYFFGGRTVQAQPHILTVGDCETWIKHSDHVPLILDI